jgi:hypothetical protein
MDQQLQWLKDDIQAVKSDVKDINAKVDEMLQFKWQIIGGSMVMSAILGIALQIFIAVVGK